jgi:2-isopropylmalate synthase
MSNTNAKIEIYDTTLRDGSQALGVSLSGQDKLLIAEALDRLGVDYIEGGYPLSNPKDEAFFRDVRKLAFKHARLAAFGMTRRKGIPADQDEGMLALLASEAPVVTLVGKSWDMHVREVLQVPLDENLAMIADSVALMAARGRETIFDAEHFFDGWRENPAYALATLRAAHQAGATRLVLCDTNGGSLPEQIADALDAVTADLPAATLGIHCHNDCDLAVANSLAAVSHGARHVQGTMNGIGERCGNADLSAVIGNLAVKCGRPCLPPGCLEHLTEISRFVYEVANLNLRENQPFVGAGAFAHKGGMHVHAVRRNVRSYEHMDPAAVGNARRVLVSELSGASNIAAAAPAKFGIAEDKAAQRKVLKAVMQMENGGYQFEAAEASFEVLIRRTLGGSWYRTLWDMDHYRTVIMKRDGTPTDTEAVVKVRINGDVRHTVAEGDGPVDSLYLALRDALHGHYPAVDRLHLVDYKVRVVNTAAETAAKVRVMIDWHDQATAGYFGSVGVSENIIEASWLAIVDAIEFTVLNSLDRAAGEVAGIP